MDVLIKKLLALLACCTLLAGCGAASFPAAPAGAAAPAPSEMPEISGEASPLRVTVTTSFLQDMVSVLAPDCTEVTLIIPAGEDPHTYEPRPEDIRKLADAELILYHGLHFEGKMIELLEAEGGVAVSAGFAESEVGSMEENGILIIDPHFWFDIDLYKKAVLAAADALAEKLPEHSAAIRANCAAYQTELDELDSYIRSRLADIPEESRILVTPHDAFNYFSRRYGMEVRAPQGVSTDAELSNREMAETAEYIAEHRIRAIFAESTTDPARMEKLRESCASRGFSVAVVRGEGRELFSDSLAPAGQDGDSYITMYRHNVDLIAENLSHEP